jgi:glucose/arabinose dehydrogenase
MNKSFHKSAAGVIAALFFLLGGSALAKTIVHVGAGGDRFSPVTVTIEAGEDVEWDWDASFHSVTSGTPGHPTGLFDSGVHQTGYEYSYRYASPGTFSFYCSVHGGCCSMVGTVIVTGSTPTPTPSPTPSATPTPTPSPTPPLPRISPGVVRVELERIAGGLTAPNDLVPLPDGRLFVVEQTGGVRLIENNTLVAAPFLNLSARLVGLDPDYDERGLLGLAFHPGFANPASPGFRKFYTYTSEPVSGPADFTVPKTGAFDHQSVVAEWQASAANPNVADPATRREVLRIDEPQANHNGGKLAFRPGELYLYISLGDGGAANDVGDGHNPVTGNARDLTTVLGKILRIDPLDPTLTGGSADPISANGHYRVPAGNPFISSSTARHEIYAYGLRNPFRFSFDPPSGRLIVGDVGQSNLEEVDFVEAGKNYGWNLKEGSYLFDPQTGAATPDDSPDPALVDPVVEYFHSDGEAVIGGVMEGGSAVPALSGFYVFGDFFKMDFDRGRLFYSDFKDGLIQELSLSNPEEETGRFVKGFGTDAQGEVYVLLDANAGPSGSGGVVDKITPITPTPSFLNLSARLLVGNGDDVLIGGFIVTGSDGEDIILRGLGPSLSVNGQPLPGALADPKIELHDGAGAIIASNDNWMNSPQHTEIASLGLAPNDDLEAALLAHLDPGNYTVILTDANDRSGIGLVELYAVDSAAPANPVNLSTRGLVQTGDDVLIGGFIIGGSKTQHVLVRAIGPSLGGQNVIDPLLDPTLELHDGNGALLRSNDNWADTQAEAIVATGIPPMDAMESAIVTDLLPGDYTAVVRGAHGTSGVALVEVYDLP